MVFDQGGLSGCSLIRVVFHQGGLSSGWSVIWVVSHQGGLSSGWSLTRMFFGHGFHSVNCSLCPPVDSLTSGCGLTTVHAAISCIIQLGLDGEHMCFIVARVHCFSLRLATLMKKSSTGQVTNTGHLRVSLWPGQDTLLLFSAWQTPKGRPGMSDVSPLYGIFGLSLNSTLLSPLLFLCLVLLLSLSYLFSACWSIFLNSFQRILQYFLLRGRLFCMAPV